MKEAILIISTILLISEYAECQWYQKYFGVNDPGLLSTEQIDIALKRSKDGIAAGSTISIMGAIGILSGIVILLKDYPDEKYPDQAEMGKQFGGAALAVLSLPAEIIGLVVLNKNKLRKSEIEKFMVSVDMKVGFTIFRYEQTNPNVDTGYSTCFTITYRF